MQCRDLLTRRLFKRVACTPAETTIDTVACTCIWQGGLWSHIGTLPMSSCDQTSKLKLRDAL